MAEYIEREQLKQAFASDTQSIRGWDVDLFDLLMDEIDEMPTADVVSVVRCKDCKYYRKMYKLCSCRSDKFNVYLNDNDFCSYGERKDG